MKLGQNHSHISLPRLFASASAHSCQPACLPASAHLSLSLSSSSVLLSPHLCFEIHTFLTDSIILLLNIIPCIKPSATTTSHVNVIFL